MLHLTIWLGGEPRYRWRKTTLALRREERSLQVEANSFLDHLR